MPGVDLRTAACVVPDLDDELTAALTLVEELLLTVAAWEDEPAEDGERWVPPEPLAGRVALEAVRWLWDVLTPTQGAARRGGRWLAADGRYELVPLSVVKVRCGDVEVLAATARLFGRGVDGDLAEALDITARGSVAASGWRVPTGEDVAATVVRLHALLELSLTATGAVADDLAVLAVRAVTPNAGGDVVLTAGEEAAYHRCADRFNAVWAGGSALDRYRYGTRDHR